MFNYRNINLTFGIVLVLIIAAGILTDSWWFMTTGTVLAIIAWLTILALGAIKTGWNFYFFSYSHGDPDVNAVALTFDDGPHPQYTHQVLDVLEKYQIKAAFFCIGKKIEEHPEVFKKIVEKGHSAGNHSYSHSIGFDFYPVKRMMKEISKCDVVMEKLTGKKPLFFRPPYGITNPSLKRALNASGHIPVAWSLRSLDTVKKPEDVIRKVIHEVRSGDIVLFHDRLEFSAQVVETFILHCLNSGIKFIPLDELLNLKTDEGND